MIKYDILIIILVGYCLSCNNSGNKERALKELKMVEVNLDDSLGVISFEVPIRYDTGFSWIHYSDCNTCHIQKYRFQSKETPILKESGFYWNMPKDSVDRFTIEYNKDPLSPGIRIDTVKVVSNHHFIEQEKSENRNLEMIWDTTYKINDRYFTLVEMEKPDSIYKMKLSACTTINGNDIYLSCELISGNDELRRNFFSRSIHLINSIMIKNGRRSIDQKIE